MPAVSKRRLIIDDEYGFALIVQRAAEEIGLQVRVLTDATYLEEVLAAAPDVITLDMEMPIRHGLDVLKALSARKRDQRVVIISGTPPPLVADRQLAAGLTVCRPDQARSQAGYPGRRIEGP